MAFEEAGKCPLCIIGLMMPDQPMAEFPFYDLVGSHLSKLPAARPGNAVCTRTAPKALSEARRR